MKFVMLPVAMQERYNCLERATEEGSVLVSTFSIKSKKMIVFKIYFKLIVIYNIILNNKYTYL